MSKNSNKIFHDTYNYVTSGFGWRKDPVDGKKTVFHNGVDYGTNRKKIAQFALEEGTVLGFGTDKDKANYVYIRYDRLGYIGMYYHLDSIAVKKVGQVVDSHTLIGYTGKTGRATGIHLHFGWMKIAEWVKPFSKRIWEDFEKYIYPNKPVPAPKPVPVPVPKPVEVKQAPVPAPKPAPAPKPIGLCVGDKVIIQNTGNGSSFGTANTAYGKGWVRYVTKIYEGRAFPYQVGNKGLTDSRNTTGFYKATALKKI